MWDNLLQVIKANPAGDVIFVIVLILQLYFLVETCRKLSKIKALFPGKPLYTKGGSSANRISCDSKVGNQDFKELLGELNDYFRKNEGTTDFTIVHDKTERIVGSLYDDAVSKLSFPTYLGLMGTFLGVFVGLLGFSVGESDDVVQDDTIRQLINGVIVSMLTSLVGLLFSTIANWRASYVKKELDRRKNVFYEFIQNELMPELDTSIVSSLASLKSTINSFTPAFNSVIENFKNTFQECTSAFGAEFKTNVVVVSNAVKAMGDNMTLIKTNIDAQQKLLDALQSAGMNQALKDIVTASERFRGLVNAVSQMERVKNDTVEATNRLITTQKDYNESLSVPLSVAERLNSILDRVTTFEQSINDLGERLNTDNAVSIRVINYIDKVLTSIEQKQTIALRYADTANEGLEALFKSQQAAINSLNEKYARVISNRADGIDDELTGLFSAQTAAIKSLNDRYARSIGEHAVGFETMIDEINASLRKKWDAFVNALDNAFDIAEINEEFSHLRKLDDIDAKLLDVKSRQLQQIAECLTQSANDNKQDLGMIYAKLDSLRRRLDETFTVEDTNDDLALLERLDEIVSKMAEIRNDELKQIADNLKKSVDDTSLNSKLDTLISKLCDLETAVKAKTGKSFTAPYEQRVKPVVTAVKEPEKKSIWDKLRKLFRRKK